MKMPFKFPESAEEWQCAFTGFVAGAIIGVVLAILLR